MATRFIERDLGAVLRLEVGLGVDLGVVGFVELVRFRLEAGVTGSAGFRFLLFFRGVGGGGWISFTGSSSSETG